MQTLKTFVADHGLTMEAEYAESNPNMVSDEAWSRAATHYLCTLRNAEGQTMAVPFSMGPALTEEPSIETVLDTLASDASSVADSPDWLDWAEEMGFDAERGAKGLREARETHGQIVKQSDELKALVGDEAFEALLYNTERL